MTTPLTHKRCPGCDADRPTGEFYAEPGRPGGLSGLCKECKRAQNRRYWKEDYYPAHKERQIAAVVARRREKKTE